MNILTPQQKNASLNPSNHQPNPTITDALEKYHHPRCASQKPDSINRARPSTICYHSPEQLPLNDLENFPRFPACFSTTNTPICHLN